MSTTCGGIIASAGQTVPGTCPAGGWCRALIRAARPLSARCSDAVDHRPLPGTVWAPLTHRSTLTGTKDTGRLAVGAFDGQPTQGGPPATTGPPLTVGTGAADVGGAVGVAGADDAVGAAGADDAVGVAPLAVAPPAGGA